MALRIKICGLSTPEAVDAAVEAGATHLGFVVTESPRRVEPDQARRLAEHAPEGVTTVAVFRHPTVGEVERVLALFRPLLVQTEVTPALADAIGPDTVLPVAHDGPTLDEDLERIERAVGRPVPYVLEGPGRGGRGVRPDWTRAARLARTGRVFLAGGLTPENVAEAIQAVRPWGVDVSSGVERVRGRKDPELIHRFVTRAREAA